MIGGPNCIPLSWMVENLVSIHFHQPSKWGSPKLRGLKKKGKKQGGKENQAKERDEEEEERKLKGNSPMVLLATNNNLFKEYDKEEPMFLLAHDFYSNHSTSLILYSISIVFWDYEDVFWKELPEGLSPLQVIEHKIGFVSGSQLPNKPANQSNPNDTKELQRQVVDSSTKGTSKRVWVHVQS